MKKLWMRWFMVSMVVILAGIAGCQKSPVDSPTSPIANDVFASAAEGPVQFVAHIQTRDTNRRMLTFSDRPDTVLALQNCQITRLSQQHEAPIPFDSLKPGDSIQVNGERRMDGYVYAWKIKACTALDGKYDLGFRDTIITIDYAGNSFTVRNHTELITVDENTVIWGMTGRYYYGGSDEAESNTMAGKPNPDQPGHYGTEVLYAFTDLVEGDVVEVRAKRIDASTLLAVSIKVANCGTRTQCLTFESTIATLDLNTRLVTFDNQPWIGLVCQKADLEYNGTAITLADFAVGDAVSVKGIPLTGDTLRVCQMVKL